MSIHIRRSSSALLLCAGFLVALSWSFHHLEPDLAAMQSGRWLIVHSLAGLGMLLTVPGLLGCYAQFTAEGGVLGLTGCILAVIGSTLLAGSILFVEVATMPFVATLPGADALFTATPPAFMAVFGATFFSFSIGYALLGIVMLRSRTLPGPAGLLLMLGAPLFAAPAPPTPVIVNTIGAVMFGLGLVWLGLMAGARTSVLEPLPASTG